MEFEVTTLIERPVHEVFEACNDPQLQIAWTASLVDVQIPDPAMWGKGAHFRQIHEDSGVRQEFEGVLVEYQLDEYVELELTHPDFTVHTELHFEDLGQSSRITQSSSIELKSIALKLARAMIRGVVEHRMDEDFVRLKVLLEGK